LSVDIKSSRYFDDGMKAVENNIKKIFGARVRALRSEKGWSQEDFAFECGLHRTYIGAVERGERNVSLENIKKIADTFKIDIAELF
jgi:transcriptional regulator with XRE-family HTH domain